MIRAFLVHPEREGVIEPQKPDIIKLRKKKLLSDIQNNLRSKTVEKYPANWKLKRIYTNNENKTNETKYYYQIWTTTDNNDQYNSLATIVTFPDETKVEDEHKIYGSAILIRLKNGIFDNDSDAYKNANIPICDLHEYGFNLTDWKKIYYSMWIDDLLIKINSGQMKISYYKSFIGSNYRDKEEEEEEYDGTERIYDKKLKTWVDVIPEQSSDIIQTNDEYDDLNDKDYIQNNGQPIESEDEDEDDVNDSHENTVIITIDDSDDSDDNDSNKKGIPIMNQCNGDVSLFFFFSFLLIHLYIYMYLFPLSLSLFFPCPSLFLSLSLCLYLSLSLSFSIRLKLNSIKWNHHRI